MQTRISFRQAAQLLLVSLGFYCCSTSRVQHDVGAVLPSSWTNPYWYLDPVNSLSCTSDANSCTSATCVSPGVGPCVSAAQIVKLWKTSTPILPQLTTVQWLSDGVATDPWYAVPTLIGNGGLALKGTLIQLATATIGTYTAPNFTAGTKGTITALGQSGAYWTPFVGMVVHDATAAASFVIDADLGSATASISTPFALPVQEFPTGPATIVNNDALTIYRPSTIYGLQLDTTGLGNGSGGGLSINALTLAADYSFTFGPYASVTESVLTSPVVLSVQNRSNYVPALTGCFISSTIEGSFNIVGGSLSAVGNNFQNGSNLDGDVLVNLRIHYGDGQITFRRVYFAQTNDVDSPVVDIQVYPSSLSDNANASRIWGPGGLNVYSGMHLDLHNGSAVSTLLLKGTLMIDSSTTAYPWVAASHAFGAGLTITAVNIDANGNLQNPAFGSIIAVE
jgi:hypothetical protein